MYPHRIRLRGPWECEAHTLHGEGGEPSLPRPIRVQMPCRWGEAGTPIFTGGVRLRRRFGYPGRLDAHERVWLTFEGIADAAEIRLNDRVLGRREGGSAAFEFEVTSLLRPRNELVLEIECPPKSGGLWAEVALEVRCSAFLRDLDRFAILKGERAELRVSGVVAGSAERPLELYVILDRSVVAYQVVTATAEGQPFEVVVDDLAADKWRGADGQPLRLLVQVDLVHGATVWYSDGAEVPLRTMAEPSA